MGLHSAERLQALKAVRQVPWCMQPAGLSASGKALGALGLFTNGRLHAMQVTHEKDAELVSSAERLQALEAAQRDAAESVAAREAALLAQLRWGLGSRLERLLKFWNVGTPEQISYCCEVHHMRS